MSVAAAEAGKDIWCEKPMTRTIGEGRTVVEAVQKYGRIFRVNTWFRFQSPFYGFGSTVKPIKKIVQSGLLGWPLKVTVSGATGFDWKFYWSGKTYLPPQPVPKELDYDFWLGPAPFKPYHPHRVHQTFRGYWDYDGGGLGDMGMHYLDPVQYVLDKDGTSPVEIEADVPSSIPTPAVVAPDPAEIRGRLRDHPRRRKQGGRRALHRRSGRKAFSGDSAPTSRTSGRSSSRFPTPSRRRPTSPRPSGTRRKFALNEDNGHRSCTLVNLAKIAVRLGRPLRFDPVAQRFIGDDEADRLIDRADAGALAFVTENARGSSRRQGWQ